MANKCVVCEVLEVIGFVVRLLPRGKWWRAVRWRMWWRIVRWRVQELRRPSQACPGVRVDVVRGLHALTVFS